MRWRVSRVIRNPGAVIYFREQFVKKVNDHFTSTNDWGQPIPGINMNQTDIDALNQTIELLSLIDEVIEKRR